ncbi:hypothetical protein [Sphingomonas sp. TREG-RG-20F-R18-01]|uniref:hypothetical protein n=1 Tax=Sphingomonas sp. TREG-RG-20F-R18-01 TaxID=2914982 RepID=UPI001F55FD5D|nr:hypothetical protein [Sphingomonas sp. TREG-RG-20F-R18-01]
MEKLPVIFRRPRGKAMFENDDVTAVFPTVEWGPGTPLTVYAHVGQHGGACYAWYRDTIPAKREEHAELLRELTGIYSDASDPDAVELVVYKKITPQHRAAARESAR